MNTTILDPKKIENEFKSIINSLSDKERSVIDKRVGFTWQKETLQNIWNHFLPAITRERVRQIEESGIKKMWRIIKSSVLALIQIKAKEVVTLHWGMASRDRIINYIISELKINWANSYVLETIIQADLDLEKSKPKLWTSTYFTSVWVNKNFIEAIHKEAIKILKKKKDVVNKIDLYKQIKTNLADDSINLAFIESVMEIFEDIVIWEENLVGLTSWKILNPKTLKDKAIYVMKKEKIPMHFVDISNKITEYMGEKVKVNTIHNELIRNEEFVLIGRWLYALKEWGFKTGTVIDVIIDILEKAKTALSTEDIIKWVLKVREVKKSTIYMNLQNKDVIERVWRNFYTLKK